MQGKGGRLVDLKRLLGDAKWRAGQEVVGVRSVERSRAVPAEGSYRERWNSEETTFLGTKFRADAAKIEDKRRIP